MGDRVDVNEELKLVVVEIQNKNWGGGSRVRGRGAGEGSGWWGARSGWGRSGWWGGAKGGCERNVGGRGDVGYWGCEPRIESIVQCTKRYCTMLRKLKKCVGGGAIFEPKTLSMYIKKRTNKK